MGNASEISTLPEEQHEEDANLPKPKKAKAGPKASPKGKAKAKAKAKAAKGTEVMKKQQKHQKAGLTKMHGQKKMMRMRHLLFVFVLM